MELLDNTTEAQQAFLRALGSAVVTRRVQIGITQEDVCKASGVNKSLLVRLEHGLLDIEVASLHRIAEALRCDPADLVEMAEREMPTTKVS